MRVVSNKALTRFADRHPESAIPLQAWRRIMKSTRFSHFGDLRNTFNSVDCVRGYFIFNVGGNKFRVVAAIHFDRQMLFVRHVFTHAEYDEWSA